mgnify:CR=1 FL=1
MDTQEKERKDEEIAAQTAETQEQPAPAQPSEAALKEEKKKVEAELNKGFPGNRSVGKLFWGYLRMRITFLGVDVLRRRHGLYLSGKSQL